MSERQVNVGSVYSAVLWGLALTFIATGTLFGLLADQDGGLGWALAFMGNGVALLAGAATSSIRNMFRRQDRMLQQAFDLGCEASNVRRFVR